MCSLCKQEILPPCDLDFIGDVSNRPWLRGWRRSGEEVEEGEACSFRSSRLTNGADTHLCPALFPFSSFFSSYLSLFPFFLPRFTSFPTSMQSHVCLRRASRRVRTKHLDFGFIHSSARSTLKEKYLTSTTIIFHHSRENFCYESIRKRREKIIKKLASSLPPRIKSRAPRLRLSIRRE